MPSLFRAGVVLSTIVLAAFAGGCTQVHDHKGYIADMSIVSQVAPGIDNRDSVTKALGRPSFTAEWDPNTWYYVSRETRQLIFSTPKPVSQMLLTVRFDQQGNVASVSRGGMEKVVNLSPDKKKTPTLGSNRGFFSELFGNIGQVGATGKGAPTSDNPD
jgi:outer membrane protein assembly factor BamE (lipoprotein component of BamABCDE complex)